LKIQKQERILDKFPFGTKGWHPKGDGVGDIQKKGRYYDNKFTANKISNAIKKTVLQNCTENRNLDEIKRRKNTWHYSQRRNGHTLTKSMRAFIANISGRAVASMRET